LSIGMQPFAELSFMPATLASGDTTVFRYHANVTPPRNYQLWGALIDTLVRHWVERYGAQEMRQWYLEVWNEPNLKAFWTGGKRGYYELYRTTVRATWQDIGEPTYPSPRKVETCTLRLRCDRNGIC
jgi:xylan 1,4-beta-xylosidase